MVQLTPRQLQIPAATARWFYHRCPGRCRWLGLDVDELEGVCFLALARAVRDWDEGRSPSGLNGLDGFLIKRCRWACLNEVTRRSSVRRCPPARQVYLSHALSEDGDLSMVGSSVVLVEEPGFRRVEARDAVHHLLANLDPRDADVVLSVDGRGDLLKDVAARLGVSDTMIGIRRTRGMRKMREIAHAIP